MNIIWSDPAVSDLEAIWEYISRDSTHYARRVIARLLAAVEPLADFPEMGRKVPEAGAATSASFLSIVIESSTAATANGSRC